MSLSKKDIMEAIRKRFGRIEEENFKVRFKDYNKTLQFNFTDNPNAACHVIFKEGTAMVKEGIAENPEFTITTSTEPLNNVVMGTLSPMRAFMNGKLKSKGNLNELSRLIKFLDWVIISEAELI